MLGGFAFSQKISNDSTINPKAYNKISEISLKAKELSAIDIKLSIDEYNKALKIATQNGMKNLEGEILYLQGKNFLQLKDNDTAIVLFLKSVSIYRELKDYLGLHRSLSNICAIYYERGQLKEGLELVKESEMAAVRADYNRGIGIARLQKGNFLLNLARYDEAIKAYQNAADNFENISYTDGVGMCYNNIAAIHYNQENYEKALEYYMMNLEVYKKSDNTQEIAHTIMNIATYYAGNEYSKKVEKRQNLDSAFHYYMIALDLYKKQKDNLHIAMVMNNLAGVNIMVKNFNKANEFVNIAENIAKKDGFISEMANSYRTKGLLYSSMGEYEKSIEWYSYALKIFDSLSIRESKMVTSFELAEQYDRIHDYKSALMYYKNFIELNDSLRDIETRAIIEQMTARYDSKLKDEKIAIAEQREKDLNDKNEAQRKFNLVLIIAIFIVIFFLVVVLYLFVQKKKSNVQLALYNAEIKFQKEVIEKKELETTESIEYAKNIQYAMLPHRTFIEQLFGDKFFVLFKPLNIVSGDFYWFGNIGHKKIFTAADCTGHGVPGAFMSILGLSFLKEIVTNADENINSSQILNKLRIHIINSLNQQGSDVQKDGMVMALAIYDEQSRLLDFSGAQNPLIIVRKGKAVDNVYGNNRIKQQNLESSDNNMEFTIFQLQPDSMHVGYDKHTHSFEPILVTLEPGDTIYIFSDGYRDQFGGSKNKKFMTKQLKQFFVDINNFSMPQQQQMLDDKLLQWKGNLAQVDDVLVMGIKIL